MPIGLSQAIASEYTNAIFWVTMIALVASWVVAVTFTPYLGTVLLKEKKSEHPSYDTYFYRRFRALVDWCIEHRWKTIAATVGVFAVSIWAFQFVQKQFFPSSNRPEMIVGLRHTEDSSFALTEANARKVEQLLAADEDIVQTTTYVGQSAPRFYLPLVQEEFSSPNYAEIVAVAKDSKARERAMARLRASFEADFPELRARIERLPSVSRSTRAR
jgi:multidrug efflux pump